METILKRINSALKVKKPSKREKAIIHNWHSKYNKYHLKKLSRLQILTIVFTTLLMTLSFLISWYMTVAIYISILVFLYMANLVFNLYLYVNNIDDFKSGYEKEEKFLKLD